MEMLMSNYLLLVHQMTLVTPLEKGQNKDLEVNSQSREAYSLHWTLHV